MSKCIITASQTWCLVRYLPLLIGDLIPEDDEYWDHFLQLLTIMDYVFAPTTTEAIIDYIAVQVEDFLVEFKRLYPDRPLTPKLHYAVHLAKWMKRYNLSVVL